MADTDEARIRSLYPTLEPRLKELDARRVGIRNTIVAGIVTAALGVGSCVTAFDPPRFLREQPAGRFGPLVLALLTFFCFGFAIVKLLIPGVTEHQNYRARFKKDIVAALVKAIQPSARYIPSRHVDRKAYDASRLFRTQLDKFRGDDLLQGSVGDTPYECSELEAAYKTGSGDDEKSHEVFKGLFMRIDFDRDLAGHTVVQAPDTESGDRTGMERIAVDPTLDEAYEIWSTKPDEARSLLTGALRDGLLKLNDDVAASLSFAFKGRTVYAAANYHKELFEPRIAVAMKEEDLNKMAAPYVDAVDIVKSLGLERRKAPADPNFHSSVEAPKGKGMEALAARVADGDFGVQDVMDAQAEDSESAPVVPPTNPYPKLTDTGPGLEVRYPVGFTTLFGFLMTLVLTPLLGVSLVTFASASLGAQLRSDLERLWPQWSEIAKVLVEYPTGFLLVTLFVWWMFAGSLAHRPSQVTIDPGGVSIRRLVWTGQTLPLDVIRRVQTSNRSLVFVRGDKSLLRSFVIASPNLRSGQEAHWLAAELRKALKRSGWRPAPRA